MYLRAKKMY